MLDVVKELQKYKTIDIDEEVYYEKETSQLLNLFNKNLERIGKDQYKSNRNTDEILEVLEEDNSKKELIVNFREKFERAREDREGLLNGIIDIADIFEDLYAYSQKSLNESFLEQMKYQWSNLQQIMVKRGITPFGKSGEIFDKELHMVREVKNNSLLPNMQILEVIRSGYMYKGEIIRKSEVVVNNIQKEGYGANE